MAANVYSNDDARNQHVPVSLKKCDWYFSHLWATPETAKRCNNS